LCLLFCVVNAIDDRLLEFNESYRVWMPMEMVEKIAAPGKISNFMDITDHLTLGDNPMPALRIPSGPIHQHIVNPLLERLNPNAVELTVGHLSSYPTRYYTSPTGVQAVNWLESQYNIFAGERNDIEVTKFVHTWQQPSIIARILGTSASDEIVIVGGHVDSTASGGIAPGADDDASGSATVLEVFRVLATSGFRPERTIEFHGYAAEEVGLRGSQAIAQSYLNEGKNIVGMLQLDMTGYVRPNTARRIGTVTDFTNPALTTFIRAITDEYSLTPWQNTACGYGCSDHASWFRAGYPSAFVFEGLFGNSNPYIHTANDIIDHLDFDHSLEFAKIGLGFAVELSFLE